MNHYQPTDEPNGERGFLIQLRDNCGSYVLIATVIRDAVPSVYDEEGTRVMNYHDGKNATGHRTASWSSSKKSGMFVENFAYHAFVDREKKVVFAARPCFHDVYLSELREAEAMAKTLRRIDASLHKQAEMYGWPNTDEYSAGLLRVANAMGITKFFTTHHPDMNMSHGLKQHKATYLRDVVANLIEKGVK